MVTDDKFFDVGRLLVIALNCTAPMSPGVILVDYNVKLITPINSMSLGSNILEAVG